MIYIQIPEKQDGRGFLILAKSGYPVVCLPKHTYGVREEHPASSSASELLSRNWDEQDSA